MKIGFDLGAQPWDFMGTPTWFVSHTHLDHVAALPVYVARRRMMKMEPPTIYVPAESLDDVKQLMLIMQRLDRGRQIADIRPLVAGEEIELGRNHVVGVFNTVTRSQSRLRGLGTPTQAQGRVHRPARREDPRPATLRRGR